MNSLLDEIDGKPFIEAYRIARGWKLQTKEDADVLIFFYSHFIKEGTIEDVITSFKRCIENYGSIIKIKARRGKEMPELERSIQMWQEDIEQIKKAYNMVYLSN